MNLKELTEYIKIGNEIEIEKDGKKYSITYYSDDRKDYISFCEFYQDTLDVASAQQLWESTYHGFKIADFLSGLKPENIYIF